MNPTEEEIHEIEKLFTEGLRLQLQTIRRKLPDFKGSRRRGSEVRLSRKVKRAAVRFARVWVKGYFIVQARDERAFRQN